jgi:TolB-like protein
MHCRRKLSENRTPPASEARSDGKHVARPPLVRAPKSAVVPGRELYGLAARPQRVAIAAFDSVGEVRDFRRAFEAALVAQIGRACNGRLTLLAHSTSMLLRSGLGRPCELGRVLNVRYIVEGSICADAGRVYVTAALVDANREACIWNDTGESALTGSLAEPLSIARELSRSMTPILERLSLGPSDAE